MSRRRGNFSENQVCEMAEALGYCAFPARGSRGPVDVLCFGPERCEHGWRTPHAVGCPDGRPGCCVLHLCGPASTLTPLVIQVGGAGKAVARTLAELDAAPRPIGSLCVVARRIRAKNRRISWRFSTAAGTFATLAEAIAAPR